MKCISPLCLLSVILFGVLALNAQAQTPVVTTLAATGITGTNATLNATVNPGTNGITTVYFSYTTDTNVYNGATIPNPSFEANSFATSPGYVALNSAIIGWTASSADRVGLNPAGGNPFADNGAVPNGANVAFIQSNNDTRSLSTTISNLVVGKTYQVSFRANCRSSYYSTSNAISATWSLNSGSFVPFTATPPVGGTNPYYTNSALFTATASTAALVVQNSAAVDSTLLVDAFSIASIPYGSFSVTNTLAATNASVNVSNVINGLLPGTTYHFRIIAINSSGTSTGSDVTFTTSLAAPISTTLSATGINGTTATLNALINPGNDVTSVYFEYSTNTDYVLGGGTIPNGSFESNSFTVYPGYISGNTSITGWGHSAPTRTGLSLVGGGSPFVDNGAIPDGANVAFIQCSNSTSFLTNIISGLTVGKSYQVGFRANCRSNSAAPSGRLFLNSGSFVPFTCSPAVGGTNPYYANSANFTATASTATMILMNTSTGDSTLLVDAFSIAQVPPFFKGLTATNTLAATNTSVAVSNIVTGLQPGMTYHFRVVAINSVGKTTGSDITFVSGTTTPIAATLPATAVNATNVVLNGTINPNGGATAAYFQFGSDTNYSYFSGTNILASTNATLSVSNVVGGLLPGTLYHFRTVASNSAGIAFGIDRTFTTIGFAGVTTTSATDVAATNVTLNGTVNPGNGATVAYFEYGTNASYGSVSSTNSLSATNTALAVSNAINNLSRGTLYHFRLVASNIAGITLGGDQTFTTIAVPTVVTLAATDVGPTNATFNGSVNPGGGTTTYYFQYSSETNYSGGVIPNPSFESNSFTTYPGYVSNNTAITGWIVSNTARTGLNPAGSSPFADNGATPSGANVAFLQGTNNEINTFSTTITGLMVGGTYQVSFRANCRSNFAAPNCTWSLNGGSFVPVTASPAVGGTNPYYTNSAVFTATAPTASLVLLNVTAADSTLLVDAFSIASVPRIFTATNTLSATNVSVAVSSLIKDLRPATKYYFQITASNIAGIVTGDELQFTTAGAAPMVTTLVASEIATNQATLNGAVNPNGIDTQAYFRYGTDTNYGYVTSTNSLTATNVDLFVANPISGLAPATLYHFQLVASNSSGVTIGADQTFTSIRLAGVTIITNAADSGPGTLRQMILDSVPNDTILFDASLSGSTISVTSGQLRLTNNVTIDASSLANGIRINGNGSDRIFQIESNVTVVLSKLTLTNGTAVSSGGGIYNAGALTLNSCTLVGNSAVGVPGNTGSAGAFPAGTGGSGGTGGQGAGGAIYNTGTLTINQCTLAANSVRGGNGGTGGKGGAGFIGSGGRGGDGGSGGAGVGAAIYSAGQLVVNQSTVAANTSTGGDGGAGGAGGAAGTGSSGSPGSAGSAGNAMGAGIYETDSLALFNSIVAGNSPNNITGQIFGSGANLTNGNPLLSSLGNNGGPTPTMLLLEGSPAFEAATSTPFTTDQRGFVRPMGSAPDIGAVEMTAPNVATLVASGITNTTVTLNGTVNPNGLAVSVFFQYGTTTNYGIFSPTNSLVTTNVDLGVTLPVSNLQPSTTYHFRIVAIGNVGLTTGSDLTFTTTDGVPVATTTAASSISALNATLNGTINPSGLPTTAYFEYGLTTGYGSFGTTNTLSATNVTSSVYEVVSNLSPGTLYHYRIVANNSAGISTGFDRTFTTPPLTPVVTTLPATSITGTSATLNGTLNPGNGTTAVYFQYGTTTNFPQLTATIPNPSFETDSFVNYPGYVSGNAAITGWNVSNTNLVGLNQAGSGPFANNGAIPDGTNVAFIQSQGTAVTLSTTISNLVVGVKYRVGFCANSRSGFATPGSSWSLNGGSFVAFTSGPSVGSTNAYYTNSTTFTATTNTAGLIVRNGSGSDTTLLVDAFSIALQDPGYSVTSTNSIAPTDGNVPVSVTVTGLQPATTYYFHVMGANSAGLMIGNDVAFTTGSAPPIANTLPATAVAATSATLNATVDPQGSLTTAYFEYGTTTNYGSFSATNTLATTNVAAAVSSIVSGLLPATLYHFRVVAINDQNTTKGGDQTFTTMNAAPTILPLGAVVVSTNAANGFLSVQLSAMVSPNGSATAGYFEYGLTTAYAATNGFSVIPAAITVTNVTATVPFSAGFSYHWRVVATNSIGSTVLPDQIFSLGSLAVSPVAGDLDGDGVVRQSELEAVYNNYVTNSPWLYMTNVVGLGETNVSFALENSVSGAYTVQFSTNLVDWFTVGPASPRYMFSDTNAATLPQRFYRLVYP